MTVTCLLKSKNLQLRKNNLYLSLTKEVWERSFGKLRFSHDQAEDLITFYPRSHPWEREKMCLVPCATNAHFLYLLPSRKLIICSLSAISWSYLLYLYKPQFTLSHSVPITSYFPGHSRKYPTSPTVISHTETSSPFSLGVVSPANCHIPPYPAQIPWWIILITPMFSFSLTYLPGKIPTLVNFNSSSTLYCHPSNCVFMAKNPQPCCILF